MAWQPTAAALASEPVVSAAELRVVILSASNSHLVGQAYRRLFAQAGAAAFRHDADVGIALQANWELHAVPVRRQPPPERRSAWGLDPSRLQRFLGYLEGRIGTGVPGWWETGLLNADFYPSTHLACPADKLRYEKTQAGILVPRGTKVAAAGADLAVTVGTATAAIPRFCFAESMRHSVHLDPEMCFVAIYSDSGYPFVLRRVDLASRAIAWQAEVWAVRTGFSSGSEGAHSVELKRNGKQMLVFGAESHGTYLEAFDVRTGDCDFRFCTSYWFQFPEEAKGMSAPGGPP